MPWKLNSRIWNPLSLTRTKWWWCIITKSSPCEKTTSLQLNCENRSPCLKIRSSNWLSNDRSMRKRYSNFSASTNHSLKWIKWRTISRRRFNPTRLCEMSSQRRGKRMKNLMIRRNRHCPIFNLRSTRSREWKQWRMMWKSSKKCGNMRKRGCSMQ